MWEHYLELIEADAQQQADFVQSFYPPGSVPRYALQSILPRLNHLGEQGWELVALDTNEYHYIFKRPVEDVPVESVY